jgi:hypothetical protein
MVSVAIAAVGFAALRNPVTLWASGLFTLDLVAICAATVGGLFLRGRERAQWAGFAIFGGTYLMFAFGSLFQLNSNGMTMPPLFTRAALDLLRHTKSTQLDPRKDNDAELLVTRGEELIHAVDRSNPGLHSAFPQEEGYWQNHRRIGHALTLLLFAIVGAHVGDWCAARAARESS